MTARTFAQNVVLMPKGGSLQIVNDSSEEHTLQNGSWDTNGTAHPGVESGAPTLHNVDITSGSAEIGPFAITGVYHIYCTVQPGELRQGDVVVAIEGKSMGEWARELFEPRVARPAMAYWTNNHLHCHTQWAFPECACDAQTVSSKHHCVTRVEHNSLCPGISSGGGVCLSSAIQ